MDAKAEKFVPISPRIAVQPDMAERFKIGKLRPTEDEFKGKKGYKRKYRPDGSYTWSYEFKPNDKGKMTKEAAEVFDVMRPFTRADTERQQRMEALVPKVELKDGNGSAHFVAEREVEGAERKGWRRRGRTMVLPREDHDHSRRCRNCGQFAYWCSCGRHGEPRG